VTEVERWLADNIQTAYQFGTETYLSIADFCVMWAIFECTELNDTDNSLDELTNVASRVSQHMNSLDEPLAFWRSRYVENGQINGRFTKLRFSHQPHIELVHRVLLNRTFNTQERIHALLLIVYRLRNNLFHGAKDITTIDGQRNNLDMASKVMRDVITSSGRHIFLNSP